MGFKQFLQKAGLRVLQTLAPHAEEDSWADLKREELEGKLNREHVKAGALLDVPPLDGEEKPVEAKPIFRRDGQVHNFNAKPWPGRGKPLTRAQYDARYGGARPAPKHTVAKFVDFKTQPEDFLPGAVDHMYGGARQEIVNEDEE